MEHPPQDSEVHETPPVELGPEQAQPVAEDAAEVPSQSGEAAIKSKPKTIKSKPKTMYELKVGPLGSRSSNKAVAEIRRALREAIGHDLPDSNHLTLQGALSQRVRSIFAMMPDDLRPSQYSIRLPKEDEKIAVVPDASSSAALGDQDGRGAGIEFATEGGSSGGDASEGSESEEAKVPKPLHADMLFSVIPRKWYQHIRVERGRGATRSERVYFEAIHVLAYIVFMYRDLRRFQGDLLHMNQKSICIMLGITSDEYLKAIRYLSKEGYITRVVIRGLVPWDARSVGSYTFAIPRIPKLRPVTIYGKRASPGSSKRKPSVVSVVPERCPYCKKRT